MSIQHRARPAGKPKKAQSIPVAHTTETAAPVASGERDGTTVAGVRALAVLRIAMGFVFLWAFLDKTFGLGYSTPAAQAWIHGGSPTAGYLGHVQVGPMQGLLRDLAGAAWVDWLYMIGLLGLGVALLAGIGLRTAAATGGVLLALMWISEWPPALHTATGVATHSTNPVVDYHVVFIAALAVLACFAAGDVWGAGRRWGALDMVRRHPWLR